MKRSGLALLALLFTLPAAGVGAPAPARRLKWRTRRADTRCTSRRPRSPTAPTVP